MFRPADFRRLIADLHHGPDDLIVRAEIDPLAQHCDDLVAAGLMTHPSLSAELSDDNLAARLTEWSKA